MIEKTAGYVVRGGAGIEARLRENHASNPKFSFVMSSSDPFNSYYECASPSAAPAAPPRSPPAALPTRSRRQQQEEKDKTPPKPADFEFSARMPRINRADLEIVRLTALFAAAHGRHFVTALAQREAGNPQFQFLIPNHTFHIFFEHAVDQYSTILKEAGGDDGHEDEDGGQNGGGGGDVNRAARRA